CCCEADWPSEPVPLCGESSVVARKDEVDNLDLRGKRAQKTPLPHTIDCFTFARVRGLSIVSAVWGSGEDRPGSDPRRLVGMSGIDECAFEETATSARWCALCSVAEITLS